MKRIVIGLVGIANASVMPESDACRFVGSRFFKVVGSVCHENVCIVPNTGGTMLLSSGNVTLSCAEAVLSTTAILDPTEAQLETRKKMRQEPEDIVSEYTKFLTEKLNLKLKHWLWQAAKEPLEPDMSEADRMLRAMAGSWSTWSSDLRPLLQQDETVLDLLRLCREFIRDRSTRGLSEDDVFQETAPVANFYFDLQSLMGIDVKSFSWIDNMLSFLAKSGKPRYRDRYALEVATAEQSELPPLTSKFLVRVSKGITALAHGGGRGVFKPFIGYAVLFVGRMWPDEDSVFEETGLQLLMDQIANEVCPQLTRIVTELLPAKAVLHAPYLVRLLGVSLRFIALCHGADPDESIDASRLLGRILDAHDGAEERRIAEIPMSSVGFQTFFLKNHPRTWPLSDWDNEADHARLRDQIQQFLIQSNPFDIVGEEVMLWSRGELDDSFESIMRGFGRALGVALGLDLVMDELRMPEYMRTILRRLEPAPSANEIEEEIDVYRDVVIESLFEPLYFVQQGVVEVLGPAALSLAD